MPLAIAESNLFFAVLDRDDYPAYNADLNKWRVVKELKLRRKTGL